MKWFSAVLTFVSAMHFVGSGSMLLGHEKVGNNAIQLHPDIQKYVTERVAEFDLISDERKEALRRMAAYIKDHLSAGRPVRLTFVCTHNSRRSQMSQVWAAVAAAYYGVPAVEAYSGGTETTAFNPRAVAALERAGLTIARVSDDQNPVYRVEFAWGAKPLVCFSKLYGESPNPDTDFCAVMTCSQADQSCPQVTGAALRIAIPYDDPKQFDGTAKEAQMYAERSAQIAREMLYVFSCAG